MSVRILYKRTKERPTFIYIDESTTDGTIQQLRRCLSEGKISPNNYNVAYLWYKPSVGIPKGGIEHFPLQVIGPKTALYISGVTAGYGGEGPHGTITCLELLGFKLREKDKRAITSMNDKDEQDPLICLKFKK